MRTTQSILAILTLNVGLLSSQAQNPAFEPSGTPFTTAGAPVNLGMVFTPIGNITVDALGFYGLGPNTAAEQVAIYNSGGSLVAETTVTTSDLVDGYYWASISPLVLTGGAIYTVDAFTATGNWDYGVVPIVNPLINYAETPGAGAEPDGQTYDYTSSLQFPTTTVDHAADAYYGPNFSIESSAVPDGGLTALLLGLSFAGLGCIRRKLC